MSGCQLGPAGKRWRQDTIWLHVDCSNAAGQRLYAGALYDTVGQDPFWLGPFRRRLMRKALPQPSATSTDSSGNAETGVGGAKRLSDGVFVWDKRE